MPLTILSHNAYWFQGVPFATDIPPKPNAEVIKRLCAIYREVKADVICLQEIQSKQVYLMVCKLLEMSGCYCPGTILPQYGGAVFWRRGQGSLVYDSQMASLATQRMWQIVDINTGNGRLRVANIHLPSSKHLGDEGAQVQRIAEICDAFTILKKRPDVIVGDLNEQPSGQVGEFLRSHDYIDAAVLATRADVSTTLISCRIDYIWITKKMENRVDNFNVMPKNGLACETLDKEYLSDHLPLWITLAGPQ